MDRLVTYDFLLLIYSNLRPSHTVSEINGDFGRKLLNFPMPCVFNAPDVGLP